MSAYKQDAQHMLMMGRYQVLRPLGAGGMGTLFLARDLRFERRYVALKENLNRSPAAQAQFRLEAEVLATLRHPNLPTVTDHFITPDGRQFLVMDYVEGEDLQALVSRQGPQPEQRVLAWAAQVLNALEYLHSQQPPIIHRDVKPANIRVTPEGKAVLVDFGIAKYMVTGHYTATAAARTGSPGYAPIEQYAGMGSTDQRTDIYSLGATLYFVLTGYVPLEAPLLTAGQALPPPRRLNPAISPRTEQAILRAMKQRPEARFQSAAEMRAALLGKEVSPGKRRVGKRYLLAAGAGLVLLSAVIVLLFAYYTRGREGKPPAPPAVVATTIPPTAIQALPGTEIVTPTEKAMPSPEPLPTVTAAPSPEPQPTATATSGHPTSTPLPTKGEPASEVGTAAGIALASPDMGSTTGNPVSFRWDGRLRAGQRYRVVAFHPGSGYVLNSDSLGEPHWDVHLPAEHFGEWRWWVEVVEGGKVVGRSEEWMFWFQPVQVGPGTGPGESPTQPAPTPTAVR